MMMMVMMMMMMMMMMVMVRHDRLSRCEHPWLFWKRLHRYASRSHHNQCLTRCIVALRLAA
jgi:hypothetical protein